jgi:hypothetical protein
LNEKECGREVKRLESEEKSKMNKDVHGKNQSEIELLKDFINENEELEKLESITDKFNVFKSLGIVHNEIRHSNFLAWLLDPTETHGLGDYFLAAFLKKISSQALSFNSDSPSMFELDSWSFNFTEILREWRDIDILIKSDENLFLCIIENKINCMESKGQLQKYKRIISNEYPAYKKYFVFLTLEADIATDDTYIPISYRDVLTILNHLLQSKKDEIGPDIYLFISHYREMLGRYILEDSEIQEICKRIYKKHKKALDLIFEYKPDLLMEIKEYLVDSIQSDPDLIHDFSSKSYIRFISKNLDIIPKDREGWTRSKRILLFELKNNDRGVSLDLIIGPGLDEIRNKLNGIAQENLKLFNVANRKFTEKWFSIYKKTWTRPKDYEDKDISEIQNILNEKFESFKKIDLLKIEEEIKKYNIT